MKQLIALSALCIALMIGTPVSGDEMSGKVVAVVDGDTLHVLTESGITKVRLADIDCPEKSQPFGHRAKMFASRLVFGRWVTVQFQEHDRYGRIIGTVTLPNGTSLNHELVKNGYGWHFDKYSKDPIISKLQREAKARRLGLWSMENPVPPWEFRSRARATREAKVPGTTR